MIRCEKCSYDNNDGSQICLNCGERLAKQNKSLSESEQYIYAHQNANECDEQAVRKVVGKTMLAIFGAVVLIIAIGYLVNYINT